MSKQKTEGWLVDYTKEEPIINLTDCNGKKTVFNLNDYKGIRFSVVEQNCIAFCIGYCRGTGLLKADILDKIMGKLKGE